jgi:hypothetical protein
VWNTTGLNPELGGGDLRWYLLSRRGMYSGLSRGWQVMGSNQPETAEESWTAKRASAYSDIATDTEITAENCREHLDYWVRLAPTGHQQEARLGGRSIHAPKQPNQEAIEPLCHTRGGGGNWERKGLEVFPPPWDQEKLCGKCLAILNGEDYADRRS